MRVDLNDAAHRPYPPPRRPWAVSMRWESLLFAHWRVEASRLRPFVPPGLEIEQWGGSAWLGVVPFAMRRTRARCTPPLPGASDFPELNVRTYVRATGGTPAPPWPSGAGRPGVWFFSLDASSRLAVRTARAVFGLAYMDARMRTRREGAWVRYESDRTGPRNALAYGETRSRRAALRARYRGLGTPRPPAPGSLEDFLTGRYCLYAWRHGTLVRAEIHHAPWPLEPAEWEVEANSLGEQIGLDLGALTRDGAGPLLHYAAAMDVVAWLPRRA